MMTLQKLRLCYCLAFVVAFVMLGLGLLHASLAFQIHSDVSGAYGSVSEALGFAGVLGAVLAGALRSIVQHIEALEAELAKFVENDGDPKLAAKRLSNFLWNMRKPEPPITLPNNEGDASGRFS